jgi:hypothetical protein
VGSTGRRRHRRPLLDRGRWPSLASHLPGERRRHHGLPANVSHSRRPFDRFQSPGAVLDGRQRQALDLDAPTSSFLAGWHEPGRQGPPSLLEPCAGALSGLELAASSPQSAAVAACRSRTRRDVHGSRVDSRRRVRSRTSRTDDAERADCTCPASSPWQDDSRCASRSRSGDRRTDSVAHALRVVAGARCPRRGRPRKSSIQVALQRRRAPLVQPLADRSLSLLP